MSIKVVSGNILAKTENHLHLLQYRSDTRTYVRFILYGIL